MNKVAICLSGHLRKFDQTADSFKNFLSNQYDCDIFIHTWDRMGYDTHYKADSTTDITNKHIDRINYLYRPKSVVIEDSRFVEEIKRQGDIYAPHLARVPKHVGHMASMFYKIYAANELRKKHELETGTKYDWVIRCRPDLLFHGYTFLPREKTPNTIFMPRHLCGEGWLCDQFAMGLPNEMELFSSFYFQLPEYFGAKREYRPEMFVDWCMKKFNLKAAMWPCHFSILR